LVAVEHYARLLALVLIFGMMLLGFLDVVMRYFFDAAIIGAKEVQTYLIPVIVSLTLAVTQFDKKHIRMEILYDKLPKRAQTVAEYFSLLLSLFIWVLITWQSIATGNRYLETGRVINMIHVPLAYVQYIAAFGSALLCLEVIRHIVCLGTGRGGKVDAA